jgi:hypothetical protein
VYIIKMVVRVLIRFICLMVVPTVGMLLTL